MIFGLSISAILLIVAVLFFLIGFFVKKFLKWALVLGVAVLVVAGYLRIS
jgi:hypothetical protein